MYDKTKVFPIREPEGGGGGGGDVTAAGNNTFTGVNTFENNVNLGKSDSIVTVNGTLQDGDGNEYVKRTDYASNTDAGVVKVATSGYNRGITIDSTGTIGVQRASQNDIKVFAPTNNPIVSNTTHLSSFYGLARAAGSSLSSTSAGETAPDGTNPGVYPDTAKTAIREMLGAAGTEELENGELVPKLAENLTPYSEDSGTTQTQPFFLEGTATGNGESRVDAKQVPAYAFLQEKRGNMVCVNQLIDTSFTYTDGGIAVVSFSNGYLTVTNPTGGNVYRALSTRRNFIKGHKYLVFLNKVDKDESVVPGVSYLLVAGTSTDLTSTSIVTPANDYSGPVGFVFGTASAANSYYKAYIYIVDLTQWFNGNIPAYLLSHPEAFGRYYKGSLAYEPGRLEPATGRYLTSVGRNIWDEEWESGTIAASTGVKVSDANKIRSKNYISITSSTTYYVKAPSSVVIFQYDADKNYIGYIEGVANTTFTTDSTCHYIYFVCGSSVSPQTTYNHDITITEYYSGESGYDQYYPHEVLATIDTGTESLYSAGSAYDSKVPSGLITRRIGSYTFTGNETWTKNSNGYQSSISGFSDLVKRPLANNVIFSNQINSAGLKGTSPDRLYVGTEVSGIGIATNGDVWIGSDDYANISNLTGKTIYFELATPTTEQGTPFQETVPIDDFGQLSWSDTNVPQGNQIFYPVDYKAYEDTLIKYTDGDATSLVRKTDYATYDTPGVIKSRTPGFTDTGIIVTERGLLTVISASDHVVKILPANAICYPLPLAKVHRGVFYGLSKAAGVDLASSTEETAPDGTNPGVYPASAIQAILKMLLPTGPMEDGTYDIVRTVTNGEVTFSWVART